MSCLCREILPIQFGVQTGPVGDPTCQERLEQSAPLEVSQVMLLVLPSYRRLWGLGSLSVSFSSLIAFWRFIPPYMFSAGDLPGPFLHAEAYKMHGIIVGTAVPSTPESIVVW